MHQYRTIEAVPRVGSPVGDKYLTTYTMSTKHGRVKLEKSGQTDIEEYVQQDLESTKIENIMHKIALGDLSVLRQSEPQYVDTSTMPKSMMEAQNLIVRSKEEFEKYPTEVKRLFNYSAEQYINEMGTKEYLEKMSPFIQKIEKISKEKNAAEYEKKIKEGAKLNYDIAKAQAALEGGENK